MNTPYILSIIDAASYDATKNDDMIRLYEMNMISYSLHMGYDNVLLYRFTVLFAVHC